MSCYDDYQLASKVATCPIPVISGIGHSTNETVTDMVAFENKITPTEVAYFLIQQFHNFSIQIEELKNQLLKKTEEILTDQEIYFTQIGQLLKYSSEKWGNKKVKEVEQSAQKIKVEASKMIEKAKNNIIQAETKVKLLHPENVLKRGYSITFYNGKAIKNHTEIPENGELTTQLWNGKLISIVKKHEE
jgi:exodeoxyribonuclease VII large subunit